MPMKIVLSSTKTRVCTTHTIRPSTMNGSGTVTATAAAISNFTCTSGTCSRDYDTNSIVTLTAQTPVGYTATGEGQPVLLRVEQSRNAPVPLITPL